ncbi:MAG: Lrp/AsnC family transcriptional regulator [Oscillospiraceae bacterium]|nr:Lrp/AsnC family transcriptional regulator [Oscillospiraceae bacterium]
MKKILHLLESDATLTARQIAVMLEKEEAEVAADIAAARESGALLGMRAVVDWEKAGGDYVTAMIEVRVTPQRGEGFDRVAERIYQYEEVQSLYLMSGGYDFLVVITGRSLREVALFVSEKLSALESVTGTATHFLLKKYKEGGVAYKTAPEQQERVLFI